MTTAERRHEADVQPRAFGILSTGSRLNLLAVLLTIPWLNLVVWWQGWPAWLVSLPLFLAIRWLLAGLTHARRLRDLERRVAALEDREAGGGGGAYPGPQADDSRE